MSAQSLQGPPSDLRGFPSSSPPLALARVCRSDSGTWWFSNDGSGRFDLASPYGTCYLATDAYAAIREASRLGPVTPGWIDRREIRRVAPPDPTIKLAATTRKGAGRFGVTTELATIVPYDLPQEWAAAFHAHGFGGIRHELRHDPRARPSGVALFTPSRAATEDGISEPLTAEAVTGAGVSVYEVPHSTDLRIED